MKKKIFVGLLTILMCFSLTACGISNSDNNEKEDNNSKTSTNNGTIKIDGIYLNNEYVDKNDGLKQIVLFYTLNAGEKNIDISSAEFRLKINENEYTSVNITTPNLTQYYYSNTIEKVYVGKSLKVAAVFKVPDGDLINGKEITLFSVKDLANGIKMSTDDIKKMDDLTAISLDVDKEYAEKRQAEEKEKLVEADSATTKKVRNDLNGYYFDIPAYIGNTYTKYKLEFASPNKFTVTATISGGSISNSGTYTVTKGYIVLHYNTGGKDVNTPYRYESGEITIDSPFYSNDSDSIF